MTARDAASSTPRGGCVTHIYTTTSQHLRTAHRLPDGVGTVPGVIVDTFSSEHRSSELFDFETEHRAAGVVFRLRGELDLYPLPKLQEAFDAVLDQAVREVVMDLGGITFLGSSGMNFLVQADRRLGEVNGTLRVVNVPPIVYRLLEISGLHQVLDVTRAEASGSGEPEPV